MILDKRVKPQAVSEEEQDFNWYSYEVNHYVATHPT